MKLEDSFILVIKVNIISSITEEPLIILLVFKLVLGIGFAFKNYYYAVTYISWKPVGEK